MERRAFLISAAVAAFATPARGREPIKLRAGMVTGIDQVGLPIALERGFFEEEGLDVTIARPYATGVDALNALQAGEVDTVQVGVPMIGAIVRGMDLVALGNYSGSATRMGSDATMAVVGRAGSNIDPADLKTLRGKRIAASFGTINHLYILALLERAGLAVGDVTLVNTPPPTWRWRCSQAGWMRFPAGIPGRSSPCATYRVRCSSSAEATSSPISALM